MENKLFSLTNKITFLFFVFSFLLIQTSNSQCVTGDPVQDFCAIDNPRVSSLTVDLGVNVVWYNAATGGTQYSSSTFLVDGNSYYALELDASCTDTTRFEVTVNIDGKTPTDVDVYVGKCASDNPIIGDLSVTAPGTIQWYTAQTGGTLLDSNTELTHETTYWVQQTENGCTSLRVPTTVNLINPVSPTVDEIQTFCSSTNPTVGDLQAVESMVIWYDSDTSTIPLDATALLMPGKDYWAAQIAFPCESTIRAKTTVQIDNVPNAGSNGSYSECEINLVSTNLYSLLGSADPDGVWTGPSTLSGGYFGTFVPGINTEGTYTYTVSSTLGVCPNETATVEVIILEVQPPTTTEAIQTFCEIDMPTIANLNATGTNIQWYATEMDITPLNSTDALMDGEDYWASQTDATGCESATRLVVTASIIKPLPPTTSETTQTFCEIDMPTVANLNASGTGILWYATEMDTTPLNSTDALMDGEDYWASQTDATGCESAARLVVMVSVMKPLPPTTAEAAQTFCEIDMPTVGNLDVTGTGILWYATEMDTTPLNSADALMDGEDYWASQTDATGCESATRLVVTVTIMKPLPPTTTEATQTFCEIDMPTIANLDATGTGVLWYATEMDTTPLNSSDALMDGEDYWASQTDATGCESAARLVVMVSVMKPLPPTTTEAAQTFCEIDMPTVANLSATGTGILWYATEMDTTPLNSTDALMDGEDYWASQTDASGCESATRLVVTASIITPLPPTTSQTTQTFCEIDMPTVANLDATGTGILWYATEMDTTPLNSTDALMDGEDYWASQTDALGCESVSRLVVTVTILIQLPPTTSETTQTFCEIDMPTVGNLDATGTGILWYATEMDTTPLNSTDALMDGEDYWASQTNGVSGCESVTRLIVTVVINKPLPPTTTEATQTFCEIDMPTIANLDATGTGVLWYATEMDTTPLNSSDALMDGEDYWASQTDATGCESAARLVVMVSVMKPLPPTTTEAAQTFCEIDMPTVANLSATGTGILWYATEMDTTPLNSTDALMDGEDYWASQTDASGCESATRLVVTASIITPLPPTTSQTTQTFCEIDMPTVANLDATGTGILWYATEMDTTPLNSTDALMDGEDYWASQTDALGCESVSRLVVTVTILIQLPPATSETTQTFCEIEKATIANLIVTGTGILWYDTETSTTALDPSEVLVDGADYWASQTNAVSGCESASRLVVSTSITSPLPPTTTQETQTFCLIDYLPGSPTVAELAATGTNILWYISESSTTPLFATDDLINGQTYWASQTEVTGCESATRLAVTVNIVNPPIASTTQTSQTFCLVDNPTIASIQVTGDTILWFDTEISTTPLNITDALMNGGDYWALNTDTATGCESSARLQITAVIIDEAPPVINNKTQSFCAIDLPTVSNLQAPSNVVWYTLETSTTPMNPTDLLMNGSTYWAATLNTTTGCESTVRVAVAVILTDPGTPTLETQGSDFCIIDNPTLGDLDTRVFPVNGGTITWYDAYPNGSVLSLSQFLVDQDTYYAVETNSNGCASVTALEVTVDLYACDDYDVEIFDGFSPNGDGINDTFKIENIRILYPDFNVEFFNRWGNSVYTSDANRPDWNGRLNGDNDFAPSGVYYFVINFNKDNRKPIQGRLYLSR